MADLTAKFSMIDEMSDKFAGIAESGQAMLEQWSQAGETANAAFEGLTGAAATTATTADGIATSISSLQEASTEAQTSADSLSDTLNNYGTAAEEAASQTDYWTDSVGNYNKSMLEAVYSTEELVEMGYKSAAALEEEQEMFALCEQSADYLNKALEGSEEIQNNLNEVMSQASAALSELADNENVSAEAKAELERNSAIAAEAMQELSAAQQEATAAMENYDAVLASGTADLSELEAAAERAYHAADNLAEANGKASEATEELSKSTQEVSEQADKAGDNGQNAVESIAGALAAAGITAMVKEIGDAAYELADAFSEAESTVVLATGATGEALDGLTTSMMNAYAASKTGTLDETASAVGEINTRLAYTGDMLEKTTGQFLDFAAITGGDATAAVRSVTQLMNQWNVPATEMETMLSKLAYAGQASGISVDSLSQQLTNNKAILDQLGFTLDQATAMFMNFELAGTNSTAVMTGFRTALSKGKISSLDELNEVFGQIASGAMNAAQASELFGSKAGSAIVNAVDGGVLSLDEMVSALEAADGTLATTADAAQTLEQKWSQATGNVSAAFTTALEPTLSGISSGLAEMVNGIGDFLNEHPALTKAITAIGVGLGVAVLAIAAVSVASLTAIPAVEAFGATLSAAIWPITLIAAGVAAVVGVVMLLANAFSAAEDETAGMTATTREQYYELQDLNAEYEEACEKYGETSEEASRLKYQVDDLSAAFEANRQTVEEFTTEVDALCESVSQVTGDFNDNMTAIKNAEVGALALIQKYEDLASQADLTGAQEKELEAITKKLSETYPDLAAQMDSATLSSEDYVEAMRKACEQEAERQRQQQAQDTYTEALAKQKQLAEEIAIAEENIRLEQERMDNMSGWEHLWTVGEWDDLEAYQTALEELNAAQAENEATIAQIEQGWADISEAEQAAAGETISWEDAAATAYENVKDRVIELCEAYGEAYNAALESFEGQFGLFDEASMKSEEYVNSTVENAQKALESQLTYWDSYLANIEVLKSTSAEQLGITQENYEALMAYAQDGSEQAAGLASSMAEAINNGDAEAVAALANTVGEVNAKQEEIAATTADWVTNFSSQMDEIEQKMQSTVEDMNLDSEAATSATETINAYADSIRAGKGNAVAAAEEVANAVSVAFASAKTSVNVNGSGTASTASSSATGTAKSVEANANGTTNSSNTFIAGEDGPELIVSKAAAYATGTTNSEDFYIAGEDGPELIVGKQGSTVFPTEETDRIIKSLSDGDRTPINITAETGGGMGNDEKGTGEQVRRILLEITGSGAIEVGGGASKESILEVLTDHIKPILLNILDQEIYEEGDYCYEF